MGDALLYAVLPARPESFLVTVWQVGILLSANRFVRLITNEIAGRVRHTSVDTVKANRHVTVAAVIGALITAGYVVPWGFAWLLALRIAWGACWSVLRIGGYMTAIESSFEHNRGRVIAGFQAIVRCGQGGGVFLGGLLVDMVGLRTAFVVFAVVGVAGAAGAALRLKTVHRAIPREREGAAEGARSSIQANASLQTDIDRAAPPDPERLHDPPEPEIAAGGTRGGATAPTNTRGDVTAPTGTPAMRRVALLWALVLTTTMGTEMMANITGAIAAFDIVADSGFAVGAATLTGILLGARYFSTLAIGPLFGYLSDRFGRTRIVALALVATIALATAIATGPTARPLAAALLLALVLGAGVRVTVLALVSDHVANVSGSIGMSRISTVSDLAAALSPVIGFFVYGRGGISAAAAMAAALMFIALGALFLRRAGR